jgi:hypothetical protein
MNAVKIRNYAKVLIDGETNTPAAMNRLETLFNFPLSSFISRRQLISAAESKTQPDRRAV